MAGLQWVSEAGGSFASVGVTSSRQEKFLRLRGYQPVAADTLRRVASERAAAHAPEWWNGRHGGLKSLCPQGRAGSSPASGTRLCPIRPAAALRPARLASLDNRCCAHPAAHCAARSIRPAAALRPARLASLGNRCCAHPAAHCAALSNRPPRRGGRRGPYDWSSTRNGLVLRSHPIVVVPPCPGSTCVSSDSGRIFSAIDAISCS